VSPIVIRSLRLFLYLFALSMPVSISGAETSLGLTALAVIGLSLRAAGGRPLRPLPLFGPLALFLAGHVASALAGPDPVGSLSSIDWVWIALPVTVAALRSSGALRGPIFTLLAAGVVISVYAIVQHYCGIDLVRATGHKAISPMDGVPGRYLSTGTFTHHLTFAHLYQFIFLYLFTFAIRHPRRPGLVLRIAPAVAAVGLSLLFAFSRAVWLSAAFGAVLVVFLLHGRKWAVVSCVAAVLLFLAVASDGQLGDRLRSAVSRDANVEREIIYRSHWDAIRDHPVFGIGPGRYGETMRPYYDRYDPPETMPRVHAHNNFLQVWLNAGILGLAGFLWLNAVLLRRAWAALRRGCFRRPIEKSILVGGTAGIVAFLLSGLTQYNLGDSEVAMVYWFVMGAVFRVIEREQQAVRLIHQTGEEPARPGTGGARPGPG
jgi:O-antigen ligase